MAYNMNDPQPCPLPPVQYCQVCSKYGTNRCGRCHAVYYCCREHQMQDWFAHKNTCLGTLPPLIPSSICQPSTSNQVFSPFINWDQNILPYVGNQEINSQLTVPSNVYNPELDSLSFQNPMDLDIPMNDEIFSSLASELLSSDNNFWALINSADTQNLSDFDMIFGKDPVNPIVGVQNQTYSPLNSDAELNTPIVDDINIMQCASLNDICSNVIHDLNTYGICVMDNFIGTNCGNIILQEVQNLYTKGIFKKGELVNPSPYTSIENIRSDVTTWINGTEPDCSNIGNLMSKLDLVITTCNKMANNGILAKYKLHRRTKAMIACYPGNGAYYKKHIDNTHKDGRCITCIYYLNRNWNTEIHGGLLRMFPSSHASQVANIEPIFDRMLFFWSDKRNPHEVLPAFATRFAITVWYFDADERDQALKISRERTKRKLSYQPYVY